MAYRYFHRDIPELSGNFLSKGQVHVASVVNRDQSEILDIAMASLRLANRLSISLPSQSQKDSEPYSEQDDKLVFQAPLLSALTQKDLLFLRGWKQFGSCVKGFNSLGLMAEQVSRKVGKLKSMPFSEKRALQEAFLKSRLSKDASVPVYSTEEIAALSEEDLLGLDDFDLSIWSCFASTPIICSTSSNMGISLHQGLRLMQEATFTFLNRSATLLNRNEGALVIWCPDERADFMNEEKTRFLRGVEAEQPQITKLRTYINRQQRDPGALRDAFLSGGYFFPTNPQSVEEMQNLVFFALKTLSQERNQNLEEVVQDPKILATLESIGCEVSSRGEVLVRSGVEGGIYGLMVPYFILLEEYLQFNFGRALSTWNQASIGAALAAAVMADDILRGFAQLTDTSRANFSSYFPSLSKFLDRKKIGVNLKTQIHGVFDIANLQSLAQLLGVVVENHMTGRGTAFVGLGSSSYSNGNRCYEILKKSGTGSAVFRGKEAFHAATHAINPFAQALVFAEDLWRFIQKHPTLNVQDPKTIEFLLRHIKKPEPAGAAALAGYLLTRLDAKTLSVLEIAYTLRLVGFDKENFLEFCGYGQHNEGLDTFLQEASEEGPGMGGFAKAMLTLLDWDLKEFSPWIDEERQQSRSAYWRTTLDGFEFEASGNHTALYLTGDNTFQPSEALVKKLLERSLANRTSIEDFLNSGHIYAPVKGKLNGAVVAYQLLSSINRYGNSMNRQVDGFSKKLMNRLISRSLDS